MKKRVFKYGLFLSCAIVIIFMILYCQIEWHVSKQTFNNVDIIKSSENTKMYIESVTYDSNGVACIKCAAQNDNITYDYFNWVLGNGTQVYKNWTIVLTDGKNTIYKLKSFVISYQSEDDSINQLSSTGNGMVAYVKNKELIDNKELKIAVLFKDKSNNQYLLYPEKEGHL